MWVFLILVPLMLLAGSEKRGVAALLAVIWHADAAVVGMQLTLPTLWVGTGVALGAAGLLYAVVFVLPRRLVPAEDLTTEQLLKARNDARSGLLTALALAGAVVGGYVGLRQVELGREELRYNLEASRRALELTREGQITERFTHAVDQLGSQELDIRLGGIYALERIARDSQADHGPIIEILTAFLREHAHQDSRSAPQQGAPNLEGYGEAVPATDETSPRLRADVEAALTVLGRRNPHHDKPGAGLDLSQVYIRDAPLDGADLQGAVLIGANLRDASVSGANLQDANLRGANLWGADFGGANLQGANLSGTDLRYADLGGANLQGAELFGADLRGANLGGANLWDAKLILAKLRWSFANSSTAWPPTFNPAAAGVTIR